MECALSDTRSKFFDAKESGSPLATPIAHISSTSVSNSTGQSSASLSKEHYSANNEKPKSVVRSLFGSSSSPPKDNTKLKLDDPYTIGNQEPKENEVLVNEILHGNHGAFANSLDVGGAEENIMVSFFFSVNKIAVCKEIIFHIKTRYCMDLT